MYEAVGRIKEVFDEQSFASGFTKREFVVTTSDSKYPQDIKFEVVKERCALLDNFNPNDHVKVNFDLRGNEYQGRYYVNLQAWRVEASQGAGEEQPGAPSPAAGGEEPPPGHFDTVGEDEPF